MFWELKRTVSLRRFFWTPKTYVQTDGLENIHYFRLKNFVYLNLCYRIGMANNLNPDQTDQGRAIYG